MPTSSLNPDHSESCRSNTETDPNLKCIRLYIFGDGTALAVEQIVVRQPEWTHLQETSPAAARFPPAGGKEREQARERKSLQKMS